MYPNTRSRKQTDREGEAVYILILLRSFIFEVTLFKSACFIWDYTVMEFL